MTLTLDATVGGASSNAYLTQSVASAILDGVPNASAWSGASSAAKDQALVYATQLLGAVAYRGVKTTVGQALAWPRGSVLDPDYGDSSAAIAGYMVNGSQWGVYLDQNAIPARVQRACAMLALEILKAGSADIWGVDDTLDVIRKVVDVLQTDYLPVAQRRVGLRRYPSVWREILPLTLSATSRPVDRA